MTTETEDAFADETEGADERPAAQVLPRRGLSRSNSTFESYDEEKRVSFSNSLSALIGPRAVLLQIIPILTPLAVYAVQSAGSPPLVFSKECADSLPPLFLFNAKHLAKSREMKESGQKLSAKARGIGWMITLKAIAIFAAESRFLLFLVNGFSVAMSIGILQTSPSKWLIASLCFIIPYCAMRSVIVVIYLGKALNIKDHHWVITLLSKRY